MFGSGPPKTRTGESVPLALGETNNEAEVAGILTAGVSVLSIPKRFLSVAHCLQTSLLRVR